MTILRHFSELDEQEVKRMADTAIEAIIKYSQQIFMSGLSGQPTHNIYKVIDDGLMNEWKKAKRIMNHEKCSDLRTESK